MTIPDDLAKILIRRLKKELGLSNHDWQLLLDAVFNPDLQDEEF